MGLLDKIVASVKGISFSPGGDMPTSGWGTLDAYGGSSPWLMPSTRIDYRAEAGDPLQNAIIVASIGWIARTFPEARVRVVKRSKKNLVEREGHKLPALIRRPNPWYTGATLWAATATSYNLAGNAYWLKRRDRDMRVTELWYEPHFTIRPVWPRDGSEFITGYELFRNGRWDRDKLLLPEDVVHFRDGIDPQNNRLGISKLAALFREIYTDNEAANFSASLLRNLGMPGLVISPMDSNSPVIDEPEELQRALAARFNGDRRGMTMVMEGPTRVEKLSFAPSEIDLSRLRELPEERITGAIGIPPVVCGMGAGLRNSTYNNVREAKASAYESNLIPTQQVMAEILDASLLPDLGYPERGEETNFDTSQVAALQEDQNELIKRVSMGYNSGWLKRKTALMLAGQDFDETKDDVYKTDLPLLTAKLQENEQPGDLERLIPGEDPPAKPEPGDNSGDDSGDDSGSGDGRAPEGSPKPKPKPKPKPAKES